MKLTHTLYTFVCDGCGAVAGKSTIENEALQKAREYASEHQWEWSHPGWKLYCKSCAYYQKKGVKHDR